MTKTKLEPQHILPRTERRSRRSITSKGVDNDQE